MLDTPADSDRQASARFSLAGQQVNGPQTNLAGPVYGGVYAGPVYFGGSETIDWQTIDLEPVRKKALLDFASHMRKNAGVATDDDGMQRYVPLRLQEVQASKTQLPTQSGRTTKSACASGRWDDLIAGYPRTVLVTGSAGSGKTTLLLRVAHDLAGWWASGSPVPLPIYFALRNFTGTTPADLIAAVAKEAGIKYHVLEAMIKDPDRRVCLLLDGADEAPASEAEKLAGIVHRLALRLKPFHSLIVSMRVCTFYTALKQRSDEDEFYELLLLPLNNEDLAELLERYRMPGLASVLASTGLRDILQTPDILSALVQALRHKDRVHLPRNLGEVYQLYVDDYQFAGAADAGAPHFDYWHVKRRILAKLAFLIMQKDSSSLAHDDGLEEQLVRELAAWSSRYDRRRRVMPDDWTIDDLITSLTNSPVFERKVTPDGTVLLSFRKQGYRDYYVAVYLASLSEQELAQVAETCEPEQARWLQVLLILAGIKPQAAQLFNHAYRDDPTLAADVWFENVPRGVKAPLVIGSAFAAALQSLRQSQLVTLDEPFTASLLVEMLGSASPYQRLKAAGAFTQWGRTAIPPLLDAAQDPEPIIAAVAQNALLRLGETCGTDQRPLPPLVEYQNGSFVFSSSCGCNAQIGALNLIRVPPNIMAHLHVMCGELWFDPLAAESSFSLWPTPPAWFAESWFSAQRKVDWVGLAARCRWIAELSLAVLEQAKKRSSLQKLAELMRRRAVEYDSLCYKIAEDMGLEHARIAAPEECTAVAPALDETYHAMRRAYSRAERQPWLTAQQDQSDFHVATMSELPATAPGEVVFGIKVDKLSLANLQSGSSQATEHRRVWLQTQMNVGSIAGGAVSGIVVDEITDTPQPIPHRLLFESLVKVGGAHDAGISGVQVRKLISRGGGIAIRAEINVGAWPDSRAHGSSNGSSNGLIGIYVEDALQETP